MLLNSNEDSRLEYSDCDCTLHKFLQDRWSMLVHGVTNVRDGEDSLYLALHASLLVRGSSVEPFRLVVDPLITQIDMTFRKIAALKPTPGGDEDSTASFRILSQREEQVLLLVSEGKTNIEASKILRLSAFTVKNHMRRIMKKLSAGNRTEAVAKYRQIA